MEVAKAVGGAIRVKATQLPRANDTLTYPFLFLYASSVAYSHHHDPAWLIWNQMMCVVLVVQAVIATGNSMARPFGTDPMGLPLARYAEINEAQCRAVLERLASATEPHLSSFDSASKGASADRLDGGYLYSSVMRANDTA